MDHLFTLCLAGGLEHLSELLLRFPNNVHILLEIAKVSFLDVINHDDIFTSRFSSVFSRLFFLFFRFVHFGLL